MKISIVSVEDPKGGYIGWPKDRPDIIGEGDTYAELVKNIIKLVKAVERYESRKRVKTRKSKI